MKRLLCRLLHRWREVENIPVGLHTSVCIERCDRCGRWERWLRGEFERRLEAGLVPTAKVRP